MRPYNARLPPQPHIEEVKTIYNFERKVYIMTQTVIVLSANQYSITNDKTGELENEGTTIRYVLSEDMSPSEDTMMSVKGHRPAKATLPFEYFDKFSGIPIPALFEATMANRIDSQGKVSLAATDFNFISAISVTRAAVSGRNKIKLDA